MWWMWAATAWATAPDNLKPGEEWGYWAGWSGNAYTVPKNMIVLHPWIRSGVGLTRQWDLKASLIGEVLGPEISTEYAFVEDKQMAVSLEARGHMGWGFHSLDYGFIPHFSTHLGKETMFDASFAFFGQAGNEQVSIAGGPVVLQEPGVKTLRPELGFEFKMNPNLVFVLTARTDLHGWSTNGPNGVLGTYLNYGKGPLGFDVGINLSVLGLEGLGRDLDNLEQLIPGDSGTVNLPKAIPLPLPVANFWFRL